MSKSFHRKAIRFIDWKHDYNNKNSYTSITKPSCKIQLGSGKLVELCASRLNWKKSTTYTTLKKVCDKGLAQNENTIVTSLVKKEEVQEFESKHIVEESFSGSLPSFLASFFAGKKISDKEANELKKLIDDFKE